MILGSLCGDVHSGSLCTLPRDHDGHHREERDGCVFTWPPVRSEAKAAEHAQVLALMAEANELLARRQFAHFKRNGMAHGSTLEQYLEGYDAGDAAIASTAVLLALLRGNR